MDKVKVYSPRIVFRRDIGEAEVIFRFNKKGRQIKEFLEIPESIKDLEWVKHEDKVLSVYHRRVDGIYVSSRNNEAYHQLNQQLENLFQIALAKHK